MTCTELINLQKQKSQRKSLHMVCDDDHEEHKQLEITVVSLT